MEWVSEESANRYMASNSEYASQRYGKKPRSGTQPWESTRSPFSIQRQSVRLSNTLASF